MTIVEVDDRLLARLLRKVSIATSGCWIWTGCKHTHGYGMISVYGLAMRAHRLMYVALRGRIPHGLTLDHVCRVRECVNPDHLEAVTHRVNCHRGISPIAVNAAKTHCIHGHPFTPENTIIKRKPNGATGRDCRACTAIRQRLAYKPKPRIRKRGEDSHLSKLKEGDVAYIRAHVGTEKVSELSNKFGVSHSTIRRTVNRHTWSHV